MKLLKDGDSGFISPEAQQQGAGSNASTGDLLNNDPNILDFNRKELGE